jgi:hypothetical protein
MQIYIMEIAIPLLALGGLYVVSNHRNPEENALNDFLNGQQNGQQNGQEGFNTYMNMEQKRPVNTKTINYPKEIKKNVKNDLNYYSNPAKIMDRYFDKDKLDHTVNENKLSMGSHDLSKAYKNIDEGSVANYSLTGEQIDTNDFEHANMVPFFSGNVRGAAGDDRISETLLDSLQGAGSQQVSKSEIATMFKPEDNVQWAHGTPNMSNFMQDRVVASNRFANTKPWKEERVAPGLGAGYTTTGVGGFNSGMNHRDKWLPKTVNEMRVDTNPKTTYELRNHEGPLKSGVNNLSVLGRVEKHAPDTFYLNTPDRWFTTTGIEKKQTSRAQIIDKPENRPNTSKEYFGVGASTKDNKATYAVPEFEKSKRIEMGTNPAINLAATARNSAMKNDHNIESFNILPNNRTTGTNHEYMGSVSGTVSAIIAPILDILRPTRKQEVINNPRPTGDVGSTVSNGYVYNPADRAPTTIRETTENNINHLNINHQKNMPGAYTSTEHQPIMNQRDSTGSDYFGNAGSHLMANASNNPRDSEVQINMHREHTLHGRTNQGGTQIFNHAENIQIDKIDGDRAQNRWWVPTNAPAAIPSGELKGQTISSSICQDMERDNSRLDPSLLDAFRKNPYTQSLSSVA